MIRHFHTDNTHYSIAAEPGSSLMTVSRHPKAEDTARLRGDIPTELAEVFVATAAVAYNPYELSIDGATRQRRVRFYLPDGGRLDTGWADEAALTAVEAADVQRLIELDSVQRELVKSRT